MLTNKRMPHVIKFSQNLDYILLYFLKINILFYFWLFYFLLFCVFDFEFGNALPQKKFKNFPFFSLKWISY